MTKTNWEAKQINLGTAIVVAAITLAVGMIVGLNWKNLIRGYNSYLGTAEAYTVDWSELDEVYEKVARYYDGDVDQDEIIEGAKKGLVEALGDTYSVYMDVEESEEFQNDLHGEVGAGIGVEMGLRDGYVRVLRTLPDNPASEAGILAGDIFYKVDGEEVYALSTDEISAKVKGEAGTEVTVTMVRDGEEKEFTLVREKINNVSAYVDYDGTTAIVTVSRFDSDTGTMVQGFAEEFESKGIDKVILDLRNNGGGYVSAAKDLLSLWIDGEKVLIQKGKSATDDVTYADRGKAILKGMKTIVLVNGSTASASEITAAALQDYGLATIVGEQTFGKGVVQSLYELSGNTLLKVTTAHWYSPNDRSIHETGVTPDVEVERTYEDINKMVDPQLDKALEL